MTSTPAAAPSLDLRGTTITTHIAFRAHEALAGLEEGGRVELTTDALPAIDSDIRAWCRTAGHRLVEATAPDGGPQRFVIERGRRTGPVGKLAVVISNDGLLELLSPLAFSLAAALEGQRVAIYFQGPAVRVLARGFTARLRGLGRPFSRFPRRGLAAAGHVAPDEKVRQLLTLGATIYVCGPSLEHYRVATADLAFEDVTISAYLTFMEQMCDASVHIYS